MKYFIALLFCFSLAASAQDTLNKKNAAGKKHGYWKVFLDEETNPCDSARSCFYGFEQYDNGEVVFAFHKESWRKNKHLVYDGKTPPKGSPVALNGTFIWYDAAHEIIDEEHYEHGQPVYHKIFAYAKKAPGTDKKPEPHTVIYKEMDYTKLYEHKAGTYFYEEHSLFNDGVAKFWFRKGDKGWKYYPLEGN